MLAFWLERRSFAVKLLLVASMIGMWSLPWGSPRVRHDRFQKMSEEQKDRSKAESSELGRPTCVGLPSLRRQRPNELKVLYTRFPRWDIELDPPGGMKGIKVSAE